MNKKFMALRGVALAVVLTAATPFLPEIMTGSWTVSAIAQTVNQVVVKGNSRVDAETVRAYITIKQGQRADDFSIDESLKALYGTGLFKDVDIRTSGNTLVVTVVENPVINRIAFEGNKKIRDNALSRTVISKERGVLTEARVQQDVQRILETYRRSGRFNAQVEPKIIDLSRGRVDLVYEISEGDKTGVSRITVIGNTAFSDRRLLKVIRTRESGLLSFLRSGDNYDPDRLDADRELLRKFYLDHGYADFRIVSAVAELDRERNVFFITITVDEGEPYRISDVQIESNIPDVDPVALERVITTDVGDTYSAKAVEKSLEELTIEVSRSGYAFVRVTPRGDRDYENHTISLTYFVDEGTRAYIERINVNGNTRTRDYVIRREFDLAEGDAYNRVLVDRAERRLKALGYFKTVSITTEPGSSPDRVVLNVTVEEQSTGNISFGAGYSSADGFIGDVELSENNFLGRGQQVKLGVGLGQKTRTYDISFTEPYFLGRRVSAGFDLYRRAYQDNDFRSYDQTTDGATIRFGMPITENLKAQIRYNYEADKISDPEAGSSLSITQVAAAGRTVKSSLGYSLIYNSLDNMVEPHDGIYVRFDQDFAGLGGDVRYLRSTIDARYYREVYPELGIVGLVKFTGGNIIGAGKDIRLVDAFFKGSSTLRGFKSSGFGPRDLASANKDALGGKTFVAATAELQFPIWGLPEEFGLRGSAYADVGTMFGTDAGSIAGVTVRDEKALRASIGVGLIWNSPLGLLRADLSHVLAKDEHDQTTMFHFGAGTQF
ncbi:MAG: outer membrane protein assembly factor BamA [Cohaesibacteraceae bacterium]|nr:outer membrane protein assembly factor BamA [Cohaesibacteraceae bacterium]